GGIGIHLLIFHAKAINQRESGLVPIESSRLPFLLAEPPAKVFDRDLRWPIAELLNQASDAVTIELRSQVVRLAVLAGVFRQLRDPYPSVTKLFWELLPFQRLRLAFAIQCNGRAFCSCLLAMAAALRIVPMDPPDARAGVFFEDTALLHGATPSFSIW